MLLLVLCAFAAVSRATVVYTRPYVSTGTSHQFRNQDTSGNYRFGYEEAHASGSTFRDETGDAYGNKYGSYGLRDADGRYRVVNYVADENGFRADIKSNEPGVAPKDPASATISTHEVETVQKPVPAFVEQQPVYVEQAPVYAEKTPVYAEKPVLYADRPLLYAPSAPAYAAPVIHHAYNPEYPLLYQYQAPYYAPYATYGYKGTPYRRYNPWLNQKGEPIMVSKGSPMVVSQVSHVSHVTSTKGSSGSSTKGSAVSSTKGSPVSTVKGSSVKGSAVVSRKGAPYIASQGYFFYP